ncbi:flagellar hook-associated protein FlgK [Alteraurantiacibacter buctensis]|uniref:Flagellar hook-associated protein 1 n=1 Tax=Alteraurantiacibacter buctensis TaxID=1503981 RepID=A0A844YW29_9SPHN|nr:flagellar hook-associated protein FlgK [Alteraurantiacibacter buctensis]MXO71148.1 flagellar hook-associated protein FlgK [Alteraurantiacibacter buctensis]
MSGNLILIGKSGAMAARAALDVTAQNIANAANPTYARRTLSMAELASKGGIANEPGAALSGVRPDQVLRTNSLFLQTEARRTGSDLARANAELTGLTNAESAVEQAGIYPSIVDFEAALSQLASDPLSGSLRAAVLEEGRRVAQTFAIAKNGLDVARADLTFSADEGVNQINLLAGELARTNAGIARARPGSANMAVLHDQRDALLGEMSGYAGLSTTFDALGRATVKLGSETLVDGVDAFTLAKTGNANGTLSFTVNGAATTVTSGSLQGQSQALQGIVTLEGELDDLAALMIDRVNDAQATGAALDGTPAQPFFSGTDAGTIALALTSGDGIATAPAGSGARSRDISNLQALRDSMAVDGPAKEADALLFRLSSGISARSVTRDALSTIGQTAGVALSAETGVDLDQEATNLLRYQQMFQASGKVIQAAADIFDTLMGIG